MQLNILKSPGQPTATAKGYLAPGVSSAEA